LTNYNENKIKGNVISITTKNDSIVSADTMPRPVLISAPIPNDTASPTHKVSQSASSPLPSATNVGSEAVTPKVVTKEDKSVFLKIIDWILRLFGK
jgi:hypothetical protein